MKLLHFNNEEELFHFIKDEKNNIEMIAPTFSNLLGSYYKCLFYVNEVSIHKLNVGFPFDASSIELCADVEVSDFYMKVDVSCCWIEEFEGKNIVNVFADIKTFNGHDFIKCPRTILKKAYNFVKSCGLFDTIYFGNEVEFFIFDKINYSLDEHDMYLKIFDRESLGCKNVCTPGILAYTPLNSFSKKNDGVDAINSSSNNGVTNLATAKVAEEKKGIMNTGMMELSYVNNVLEDQSKKINRKKGYLSMPPKDTSNLIKYKICEILNGLNIRVERYHHEVSASQHELSLKYFDVLKNADNLCITKQIVRNVVHGFNRTVTFMPKPLMNDNGTGLHCNISLWKDNKNIFFSDNPSTFYLSKECFYFMNGLLKHAKAIQAFCNGTMNSYKRLVSGFETTQKLFYSFGSRCAAIRLPLIDYNIPTYKRIEFRIPDCSNSPHLIFAAIILAGYDGLKSKEKPLPPLEYRMGKFYISDIFTKSVENASDFESIKHVLEDYFDNREFEKDDLYNNFFRCREPENVSTGLLESLDALEKDHDFLTVNNIFSKEMIQEYIQYKREEINTYNKNVTPIDYHFYFNT